MSEAIMDKQRPFISVIVPVYNTKDYLYRCLNSLKVQSLKNIEILIVDDGSNDGSEKICDYFSEIDPRFTVIHKANEGLSAARNEGIHLAIAKYIMFVDSDDWVHRRFCEIPYVIAEKTGSEIVAFQYNTHGKIISRKGKCPSNEGTVSKDEVFTTCWKYIGTCVWNKLYRRELFCGLQYPIGHLAEDDALTHLLIYRAKRIFLLNKSLYNYRHFRPGSITFTKSYDLMTDYFHYSFQRLDDFERWGYADKEQEVKLALKYLIIMGRNRNLSDKCERIIRDNKIIARQSTNIKWDWKAMLWLYTNAPDIFDFVSFISKKRLREQSDHDIYK